MNAELLINTKSVIAEGPLWEEGTGSLYFIDLLGNRIYRYSDGKLLTMQLDQNIGCICLRERGGLLAGMQHGFYFIDEKRKTVEAIADPESDKPENRFNDGKADPRGRLWAGTMSKSLDTGYGDTSPQGKLYCLNADLTYQTKLEPVTLSNGLDWSPDEKTMYYIDTPRREVQAFDYEAESGDITNGRVAIHVPEGMGNPDGMCVDREGHLYVALWGGGCVSKWDPRNGALLDKIEVPAVNVSSCCFGGAKMDELFITTASIGTDLSQYPYAGGVFHIKPGSIGRYAYRFKG